MAWTLGASVEAGCSVRQGRATGPDLLGAAQEANSETGPYLKARPSAAVQHDVMMQKTGMQHPEQ